MWNDPFPKPNSEYNYFLNDLCDAHQRIKDLDRNNSILGFRLRLRVPCPFFRRLDYSERERAELSFSNFPETVELGSRERTDLEAFVLFLSVLVLIVWLHILIRNVPFPPGINYDNK